MASKLFKKALSNVPKETKIFVGKSMDIVERLQEVISEKGISQRELAKQLKKSPSEINKWLTGSHNFTLKTISKLEAILDTDIISVSKHEEEETKKIYDFLIKMTIHINEDKGLYNNLIQAKKAELLSLSDEKIDFPYYLKVNKIKTRTVPLFENTVNENYETTI